MFNDVEWKKPEKWHIGLSSESVSINERIVRILFFCGFTAICAQIAFYVPWTPIPYTFQPFAVLATGVYLRRNDAFLSGCLYLLLGALGAPVFANGESGLFIDQVLVSSGGYLLAFPIASALVAEGLDISRKKGYAEIKSQLIFWFLAMIPVYLFGTIWLAKAANTDFSQAFEWGVKPFLIWDSFKIIIMALVTTKFWSYSNK